MAAPRRDAPLPRRRRRRRRWDDAGGHRSGGQHAGGGSGTHFGALRGVSAPQWGGATTGGVAEGVRTMPLDRRRWRLCRPWRQPHRLFPAGGCHRDGSGVTPPPPMGCTPRRWSLPPPPPVSKRALPGVFFLYDSIMLSRCPAGALPFGLHTGSGQTACRPPPCYTPSLPSRRWAAIEALAAHTAHQKCTHPASDGVVHL